MSYDVILNYGRWDRTNVSCAADRWCEFVVGDMWDDWQSTWSKHNPDQELYQFKHQRHAEQFQMLFGRTVKGHRIIPFRSYRYFWINQFGRARIDNMFLDKGWTPEVMIPSEMILHRKRKLDGGRVIFRRNVGWFFEKERDALLFLLFDFDEGHD